MEDAIHEEKKAGTFSSGESIYYSVANPKDSYGDNFPVYNERDYKLFSSMLSVNVPKDSVIVAQKRLIELGLLDKGDDDTHLGPKTMGASRRYTWENNGSMIWDYIKDRNPFKK